MRIGTSAALSHFDYQWGRRKDTSNVLEEKALLSKYTNIVRFLAHVKEWLIITRRTGLKSETPKKQRKINSLAHILATTLSWANM
jgi:hypothetical protein